MPKTWFLPLLFSAVAVCNVAAQSAAQGASAEDVKTPQAIVAALSAAISGPAEKPRDWERMRSLFLPGAGRFLQVHGASAGGPAGVNVLTVDDYQTHFKPVSFYELPIAYQVRTYGHMTHVDESYQLKHTLADAQPFARGVNSWELYFDGTRYFIAEVFWDTESPGNPLPSALASPAK